MGKNINRIINYNSSIYCIKSTLQENFKIFIN